MFMRGWKDDSVFKSSGCSYKGPGFDSQLPKVTSQPSELWNSSSRDLMLSSGLLAYGMHVVN